MIKLETAIDLTAYENQLIGRSQTVRIDQTMINQFADLTGDTHWIHVDTERAAHEMPDGKTIAHGMLVLSFAPKLKDDVFQITHRGKGLNYGYDRVRFIQPVQVGDEVRLAVTILSVEPHRAGTKITARHDIENAATGDVVINAQNIILITKA